MYREEREMADECKESTDSYAGYEWVDLLKEHPEQACKCDWTKLDGRDWVDLLREQPQFADKCTKWDEFDSRGWESLLKNQPRFTKLWEEKVGKALASLVGVGVGLERNYLAFPVCENYPKHVSGIGTGAFKTV